MSQCKVSARWENEKRGLCGAAHQTQCVDPAYGNPGDPPLCGATAELHLPHAELPAWVGVVRLPPFLLSSFPFPCSRCTLSAEGINFSRIYLLYNTYLSFHIRCSFRVVRMFTAFPLMPSTLTSIFTMTFSASVLSKIIDPWSQAFQLQILDIPIVAKLTRMRGKKFLRSSS